MANTELFSLLFPLLSVTWRKSIFLIHEKRQTPSAAASNFVKHRWHKCLPQKVKVAPKSVKDAVKICLKSYKLPKHENWQANEKLTENGLQRYQIGVMCAKMLIRCDAKPTAKVGAKLRVWSALSINELIWILQLYELLQMYFLKPYELWFIAKKLLLLWLQL